MSGITNPAEPYFKDGLWGWDGLVWRKLPLLWGYSEHWAYQMLNTNAGAGTNDGNTALVDAGKILVVTHCLAVNQTSAFTEILIQKRHDGITQNIRRVPAPVAGEEVIFTGFVVIPTDYHLRARFKGCTAGDTIFFSAHGYTMKIAE